MPATDVRRKPRRPARKSVPGHAQALSRGLALLESLAATENGATLTALAAAQKLPAPTAHRLLAALESAGFVRQDGHGVWTIGDNQVALTFSDPLAAAAAANVANYNLAGATINGATLRPDRPVLLSGGAPESRGGARRGAQPHAAVHADGLDRRPGSVRPRRQFSLPE